MSTHARPQVPGTFPAKASKAEHDSPSRFQGVLNPVDNFLAPPTYVDCGVVALFPPCAVTCLLGENLQLHYT